MIDLKHASIQETTDPETKRRIIGLVLQLVAQRSVSYTSMARMQNAQAVAEFTSHIIWDEYQSLWRNVYGEVIEKLHELENEVHRTGFTGVPSLTNFNPITGKPNHPVFDKLAELKQLLTIPDEFRKRIVASQINEDDPVMNLVFQSKMKAAVKLKKKTQKI